MQWKTVVKNPAVKKPLRSKNPGGQRTPVVKEPRRSKNLGGASGFGKAWYFTGGFFALHHNNHFRQQIAR